MATVRKMEKWLRNALEIWGESLLAGSGYSCGERK